MIEPFRASSSRFSVEEPRQQRHRALDRVRALVLQPDVGGAAAHGDLERQRAAVAVPDDAAGRLRQEHADRIGRRAGRGGQRAGAELAAGLLVGHEQQLEPAAQGRRCRCSAVAAAKASTPARSSCRSCRGRRACRLRSAARTAPSRTRPARRRSARGSTASALARRPTHGWRRAARPRARGSRSARTAVRVRRAPIRCARRTARSRSPAGSPSGSRPASERSVVNATRSASIARSTSAATFIIRWRLTKMSSRRSLDGDAGILLLCVA